MKRVIATLAILLAAPAWAADPPAAAGDPSPAMHRYLIERSFPPGALDGLDEAAKARVNANNASVGVNWLRSFANADRTRTFCVYEGPDEAAIREAAALNNLPVDRITEVPVDLTP
jgi:hypothetical protein